MNDICDMDTQATGAVAGASGHAKLFALWRDAGQVAAVQDRIASPAPDLTGSDQLRRVAYAPLSRRSIVRSVTSAPRSSPLSGTSWSASDAAVRA